MVGAKPHGQLRFHNINGKRMAYVNEGQGDAIVFYNLCKVSRGSMPLPRNSFRSQPLALS
jgi:hypothetical protein